MGEFQSRGFDAQIVHKAICMLQYNLLSVVKRFMAYETIRALFRSANADTIELTVNERVRQIITEILVELAEILDVDLELLLENLISEDERFAKLLNLKPYCKQGN